MGHGLDKLDLEQLLFLRDLTKVHVRFIRCEHPTSALDSGTAALFGVSEDTPFWRTAFLMRNISVLSKDRLCKLSLNAYWVNLVRSSACVLLGPPGQ